MEYTICDWEQNGYHDSYFYALYWSPETGFRTEEIGATAYAGGRYTADTTQHPPLPANMLQAMHEALAQHLFASCRAAVHADINEPQSVRIGDRVRAIKAGSKLDKKTSVTVSWAAGEEGVVFWTGTFRQIYANGYNRLNRSTLTVGVRFNNGKTFLPLTKLSRAESAPSDAELLERCRNRAAHCDYATVFGGAWSSETYVNKLKAA